MAICSCLALLARQTKQLSSKAKLIHWLSWKSPTLLTRSTLARSSLLTPPAALTNSTRDTRTARNRLLRIEGTKKSHKVATFFCGIQFFIYLCNPEQCWVRITVSTQDSQSCNRSSILLPSTKVPKGANDIMTEASLAPVIFVFHVFSLI